MRVLFFVVWSLTLAWIADFSWAKETDEVLPLETTSGDIETLRTIAGEEGVRIEWPDPEIGAYTQDLGQAVAAVVESWLYRFGASADIERIINLIASILLILTASALILFLVSRLLPLTERESTRAAPVETIEDSGPPVLTNTAWGARLEAQLAAGQAVEALESLWWWLASQLLPERVDPSWTSRELLRRSDRLDLLPSIRRLDALLYGPTPPTVSDVRKLRTALNESIALSEVEPGKAS